MLWKNLHSVKVNKKVDASRRGKKKKKRLPPVWSPLGKRKESRLPESQNSTPILDGQRRSRIYCQLSQTIKGLLGQLVRENEKTPMNQWTAVSCASPTAFANSAQPVA